MFIINVEGAIYRDGKWLIIKRSLKEEHAGGQLSLVGGTVEKEGNTKGLLERTLKRELFEEVGVTIKDKVQYVRNTTFMLGDGKEVMDFVFLAEIESGEPFAKSMEEVDEVLWLTADEIYAHPKSPIWLKESIQEAEEINLCKIKTNL